MKDQEFINIMITLVKYHKGHKHFIARKFEWLYLKVNVSQWLLENQNIQHHALFLCSEWIVGALTEKQDHKPEKM